MISLSNVPRGEVSLAFRFSFLTLSGAARHPELRKNQAAALERVPG